MSIVPDSPVQNQFDDLLTAYCEGLLDEEGVARLNHLMQAHPQLTKRYIQHICIHSRLFEVSRDESMQRQIRHLKVIDLTPAKPRRRLLLLNLSLLATCVMVAAAFFAWEHYRTQETGTLVRSDAPAVHAQHPLETGQRLRTKRPFSLTEGYAKLTLDSGVELSVIGPAEFTMKSPSEAVVTHGRVMANVPPAAHGFTLTSSDARVVDLGTEFALNVDPVAGTVVMVSEGEVKLGQAQSSWLSSGWSMRLKEEQAASCLAGSNEMKLIPYPEQLLDEFELNELGISSWTGPLQTIRKPPRELLGLNDPGHDHIRLFVEKENILLKEDISIHGIAGQFTLKAGQTYKSIVLLFKPSQRQRELTVQLKMDFHHPITAIVDRHDDLINTDIFARPDIDYNSVDKRGNALHRGVELDKDRISLSPDSRHLELQFHAFSNVGDYIRIILPDSI